MSNRSLHHAAFGLRLMTIVLGVSALGAEAAPTVGWRGDGSGCYPDANPPTNWCDTAKSVSALMTQAAKPATLLPAGQSMADGVIREWLILGPLPIVAGKPGMDDECVVTNACFSPAENDQAEGLTWKRTTVDGAVIDFNALLGKDAQGFIYAHAYVYCEADTSVSMHAGFWSAVRLWVNGKPAWKSNDAYGVNRVKLGLVKGWNRVLFKLRTAPKCSYLGPVFYGYPQYYHEMKKNAQGGNDWVWNGGDGTVYERQSKNIRWAMKTPGDGCGAPIIVGDKIIFQAEPDLLVCANKADGKIRWVRSNNLFDATPASERDANPAFKELEPQVAQLRGIYESFAGPTPPSDQSMPERIKLQKTIDDALRTIDAKIYQTQPGDIGSAGFTPTSDGKLVYAFYSFGVIACYDLNGQRQWIRLEPHANFEHGMSSSPLLVDGKVILYMRELFALDAKTGRKVWSMQHTQADGPYPGGRFHGSPVAAAIGGVAVVILPSGHILNASDAKVLYENKAIHQQQCVPSPVVANGVLYKPNHNGSLFTIGLPDSLVAPFTPKSFHEAKITFSQDFQSYAFHWICSSPLVHDGLVYTLNAFGVLTVLDAGTGVVVYQKLLDIDQYCGPEGPARGLGCSPTLAGKYIYLMGNFGTTLVIKPGRQYEQVAKNRIEDWVEVPNAGWYNHTERTVACPVFEGDRMYVRAEQHLYCIATAAADQSAK